MGSQVLTKEPPAPTTMALPTFMIGDFQMETSEGFNDFMYELSVNIVTRNIANNLYPLQQIRQDKEDEIVTLETLTSFKTTKIEFKLGEEFEEYTADGRYCKTVATVEEGNKLVKVQVPDASTGYHTTKEVREWSEDGKDMTLHLMIPSKPEIVCKRFYKRVEPEPAQAEEAEEAEEAQ